MFSEILRTHLQCNRSKSVRESPKLLITARGRYYHPDPHGASVLAHTAKQRCTPLTVEVLLGRRDTS